MTETPVTPPGRESVFECVADYVSAAMGRPANIMVWLVLVIGWTALFASGAVSSAGTFLPGWFTSQGFNFPLNLVTTVAELFIGFLVAAAANRSERNLDATLAGISQAEDRDAVIAAKLATAIAANTDLTMTVRDLTAEVHRLVTQAALAPAPDLAAAEERIIAAVEASVPKRGVSMPAPPKVPETVMTPVAPAPKGRKP